MTAAPDPWVMPPAEIFALQLHDQAEPTFLAWDESAPIAERKVFVQLSENIITEGTIAQLREYAAKLGMQAAALEQRYLKDAVRKGRDMTAANTLGLEVGR